jgi:hypothetical protein
MSASNELPVAGRPGAAREAELLEAERRFLEKLRRLLDAGPPGIRQAKREIAARLSVHHFAGRLMDLSKRLTGASQASDSPRAGQAAGSQTKLMGEAHE